MSNMFCIARSKMTVHGDDLRCSDFVSLALAAGAAASLPREEQSGRFENSFQPVGETHDYR
jgi:hypothetical protein